MALIPHRLLFRMAYPCRYRKDMPGSGRDDLLDLGPEHRIDNFAGMDEGRNFGDVRLAWNETGLGIQVEVRGKEKLPVAHPSRARGSDGLTLWLDTRDARASHRASRYCTQFHLLPTGGGSEGDQPVIVQAKINLALEDAPLAPPSSWACRCRSKPHGYLLEAFLPSLALNGFDPEQHPRLGFFYALRDEELGEQLLSASAEFPFWEDPTLWSVLDLVKSE